MSLAKKVFGSVRIWILLILIVLSVIAIHPGIGTEGVAVRNIAKNSPASIAGMQSPSPTSTPMSREKILEINNIPIKNSQIYYDTTSALLANKTVQVKTTKNTYLLRAVYETEKIVTNETEIKETFEFFFN